MSTHPTLRPTDVTGSTHSAPDGSVTVDDVTSTDLEPPAGWNGFTAPDRTGEQSDAWRCPCGNQPYTGGFYTVDLNAREAPEETVEVDAGLSGRWGGQHYGCASCGRVADFTRPGSPVVRGERPFRPLL